MHIAIIGNGITATTCARFIRKYSPHKITLISGETDHFFARTALMYVYMQHLRYQDTKPYEDSFWQKNNINLMRAWVKNINFDQQTLQLHTGKVVAYDKLVIACGSKPNKLQDCKGQDLQGVQSLYTLQDIELLEKNTAQKIDRAVIVGGGLIGIELAEMLHSKKIPVTFLVRENNYWGNVLSPEMAKMINNHILEYGFELKLGVTLEQILGNENEQVKAVQLKQTGEIIDCQLVAVAVGVLPNIDWLKNLPLETNQGILVNLYQETNMPNVYAGGDCAEFRQALVGRKAIEQTWYTGKMQGKVIAENICTKNTQKTPYNPGFWFNSAKFLDIEYQTYGTVLPNLPATQQRFYWQHANQNKCIDLVFDTQSRAFIGINTLGIRLRHELLDLFLRQNQTVDYVLQNLRAANFDPEFFAQHEAEIIANFNQQTGSNIASKPSKGLASNRFFRFFRNLKN